MELAENEEPEGHAKAVPTPHPSSWGFILLTGPAPPPGGERFPVQLERSGAVPEERGEGRGSVGACVGLGMGGKTLVAPARSWLMKEAGPRPPLHTADSSSLCLKSCALWKSSQDTFQEAKNIPSLGFPGLHQVKPGDLSVLCWLPSGESGWTPVPQWKPGQDEEDDGDCRGTAATPPPAGPGSRCHYQPALTSASEIHLHSAISPWPLESPNGLLGVQKPRSRVGSPETTEEF